MQKEYLILEVNASVSYTTKRFVDGKIIDAKHSILGVSGNKSLRITNNNFCDKSELMAGGGRDLNPRPPT